MKDSDKTKEQLVREVARMRRRIAELEASPADGKPAAAALENALARLRMTEAIADRGPAVLFLWRVEPGVWPVEIVSGSVLHDHSSTHGYPLGTLTS